MFSRTISLLFLSAYFILIIVWIHYLNIRLRHRIINCKQISFYIFFCLLFQPLIISLLLLQFFQFFLHFHMPYLIFPVLLFILYTAFPARAFSVYLLLSVKCKHSKPSFFYSHTASFSTTRQKSNICCSCLNSFS